MPFHTLTLSAEAAPLASHINTLVLKGSQICKHPSIIVRRRGGGGTSVSDLPAAWYRKKIYCRRYVWYWYTYVEVWSKSIIIIPRSTLIIYPSFFFWMPILRRSRRLQLCWLIIIDLSDLGSPQKYHVTQDLHERSSLTQLPFPQHYITQKLPPFMNNACAAFKNNSIRCSYCTKTVLSVIGNLSVNSSCSMLLTRFDTE